MLVVLRTSSSGWKRPLLSMRCEAKSVLISVDLPRPVCPVAHVSHLLEKEIVKGDAYRRR